MARQILRLTGDQRVAFLQDLLTNDVTILDRLTYAALLTPQGKYFADMFVLSTEHETLLDIDRNMAPAVMQRLNMYKLRRDVQIEASDLCVSQGFEALPRGAFQDPRHAALGWRRYGTQQTAEPKQWDEIRVEYCIPESGIELISGDTYILEAGFERLNGVDFKKGCYVGQEITARMKHKSELKKGLRTVSISHAVPVGTKIEANGKEVGTIYTQASGHAIAYLRFDRAQPKMQAADAEVRWDKVPIASTKIQR